MEIKSLEGVSIERITQVFNASFSDYFIPFKLTTDQLALKMTADKIDLNLSVGIYGAGKLIAFVLHGVKNSDDGCVAYNGGTGVVPASRGAGLTREMYQFILPFLAEKGISKVVLEVITENIAALKSYEQIGFKISRKLLCYKGELKRFEKNSKIQIKCLENHNWKEMKMFWDIQPSWQNSPSSIDEVKKNNISLGAYFENQLLGYIVYNPSKKLLQQIAVSKSSRNVGVATSLVIALREKFGNFLSVGNVDSQFTGIHNFLERMGLENYIDQYEMTMLLRND